METLSSPIRNAIVSSSDEVTHLNKKFHKNFIFHVCNEVIMTVPVVFYLKKNSYLTEILSELIENFKSSGLINYWISKYLDPKYLRVKKIYSGPTKLNLRELFGAFQLLALGLICSFISFAIENCFEFVQKRIFRFRIF